MIFISYSRNDIAMVRPIVERLRERGNECWLDETDIPVGEAFVRHLGDGLTEADSYVLFDTKASRASYWVARERIAAFRKKRFNSRFTVARLGDVEEISPSEQWDLSVPPDEAGLARLERLLTRQRWKISFQLFPPKTEAANLRLGEFGQPRNWIGRQDELRILDEWWQGTIRGAWIQGMGGTGKTGLLQTWVTALDVLGYDETERLVFLFVNARESIDGLRALLDEFIRRGRRGQRKLAIIDEFDEAARQDEIHHYVDDLIKTGCQILISSRTPAPKNLEHFFRSISLGVMSERDAVALATEGGIDKENARAAAERLGAHPLALQLFSKYVQTAADGDSSAALKALDEAQSKPSSEKIGSLIERSIATLSESARALLEQLVTTGDNEGRLNDDLVRIISSDEGQRACSELARASLIQVDNVKAPRRVSMHPIVRKYFEDMKDDREPKP